MKKKEVVVRVRAVRSPPLIAPGRYASGRLQPLRILYGFLTLRLRVWRFNPDKRCGRRGTMIVNCGIVNRVIVDQGIVDQGIVDKRPPEPSPSQLEPAGAGDSDPERLRITVILTTIEGTLAALRAAANLARGLQAEIVLVVAEVVYFRYPVEHPPVESSFFERLATALADELQLEGDGFELEIHFCRDRVRCLEQSLRPRSLVMMGAKKCWWRGRERNLECALRQRGYDVIVVRACAPPGEEHAGRVVDRLLREASAPTRRAL